MTMTPSPNFSPELGPQGSTRVWTRHAVERAPQNRSTHCCRPCGAGTLACRVETRLDARLVRNPGQQSVASVTLSQICDEVGPAESTTWPPQICDGRFPP